MAKDKQLADDKPYTDIRMPFWIRILPEFMRPYAVLMRLDRPIGTWLLLFPGLWAIVFAAGGWAALDHTHWMLFGLFSVGAIIMRGAGCVVNDLWDRDIDQLVERTKERPLANGTISLAAAFIFLGALFMLGFLILLQLPRAAVILGVVSVAFIIAYPLMKRWTWWPQLFLGLTFNFGALMGWASVQGAVGLPAVLLYVGGIFWTLGYDTIYAAQDVEDDALVGVKSTMRLFQDKAPLWVSGFYAAASILWVISGVVAGVDYGFYTLLALVMGHFVWQVRSWDLENRDNALFLFKSNRDLGLLMLMACGLVAL